MTQTMYYMLKKTATLALALALTLVCKDTYNLQVHVEHKHSNKTAICDNCAQNEDITVEMFQYHFRLMSAYQMYARKEKKCGRVCMGICLSV